MQIESKRKANWNQLRVEKNKVEELEKQLSDVRGYYKKKRVMLFMAVLQIV